MLVRHAGSFQRLFYARLNNFGWFPRSKVPFSPAAHGIRCCCIVNDCLSPRTCPSPPRIRNGHPSPFPHHLHLMHLPQLHLQLFKSARTSATQPAPRSICPPLTAQALAGATLGIGSPWPTLFSAHGNAFAMTPFAHQADWPHLTSRIAQLPRHTHYLSGLIAQHGSSSVGRPVVLLPERKSCSFLYELRHFSSSSSSTQLEGRVSERRPFPTWLHIIRRKRQ